MNLPIGSSGLGLSTVKRTLKARPTPERLRADDFIRSGSVAEDRRTRLAEQTAEITNCREELFL